MGLHSPIAFKVGEGIPHRLSLQNRSKLHSDYVKLKESVAVSRDMSVPNIDKILVIAKEPDVSFKKT